MPNAKPKTTTQWGNWHLNEHNNTIEYWKPYPGDPPWVVYYIDLDRMKSAAACLDWIFQISQKTWMTNEDRGNMLLAIQDMVRPQSHLCGGAM